MRRPAVGRLLAITAVALVALVGSTPATSDPSSIAELWEEPTDLATRDLFFGPWGASNAPDASVPFTFGEAKTHGTNPGMTVIDRRGREWHVKQGREGPPEVTVSRILSAVGYHQPPVYYLPSFSVTKRDSTSTERGGRFRLTVKGLRHSGGWTWEENPFVGTPPYQGLLVTLVLLNSADLKNVNNALYDVNARFGDARRWFVVRDLGTSLGETGRFDPTPNDPRAFNRRRFITSVTGDYVRFDYRAIHQSLLDHITCADVRWASRLLAGMSERQWNDAFRAGGFSVTNAATFIERIRQKIDDGLRIGVAAGSTRAKTVIPHR